MFEHKLGWPSGISLPSDIITVKVKGKTGPDSFSVAYIRELQVTKLHHYGKKEIKVKKMEKK